MWRGTESLRLLVRTRRLLHTTPKKKQKKKQRAIATGAKLKGLVKAYLGVLGEGTRLNAEAAMVAEATDETDDFEVSIQLSQLILEKLVADVASARRTIEDQNVLLHTTATEHVSLYPSPLARAASIAARRT